MDSGDLEREKGITILAKHTAIDWRGMTVNVVDTPGHADFGGEVERGLSMVDGVLLLVDASEGPLPQTRFVLRKTLAGGPARRAGGQQDRPARRPLRRGRRREPRAPAGAGRRAAARRDRHRRACSTCPVVYASGRAGRASRNRPADGDAARRARPRARSSTSSLPPCPPPADDPDAPLQAHVTNLDATSYLGRIALCRVRAGVIRRGQQVGWCRADGTRHPRQDHRAAAHRARSTRVPADAASAGDLVAVAGIAEVTIGDTLADPDEPRRAARASTSTSPPSR